jgi:uncharacterized protein YlaI
MTLFYRNPITGKYDFLYTKCVLCGKRVRLKEKNMREDTLNQLTFYFCDGCIQRKLFKKIKKGGENY